MKSRDATIVFFNVSNLSSEGPKSEKFFFSEPPLIINQVFSYNSIHNTKSKYEHEEAARPKYGVSRNNVIMFIY